MNSSIPNGKRVRAQVRYAHGLESDSAHPTPDEESKPQTPVPRDTTEPAAPCGRGAMTLASPAHPVARLSSLLLPSANKQASALLETEGLELTFNARGALWAAFVECRASGRPKVLVPAYHCPSAISPAIDAGLEPVFYRIKRDLSIDYDDLLRKADATIAAVLVIHFFGVAPELGLLSVLRHVGVKVIEDCSHSFVFTDPIRLAGSDDSDYRIFSFWKLVPSGVGGGLLRRHAPGRTAASVSRRPQARMYSRLRAYKLLLEESIEHSDQRLLKPLLRRAETMRLVLRGRSENKSPRPKLPTIDCGEHYYPSDPHLASSGMPKHAERIIRSSDLADIVLRRRANFACFAAQSHRLAPMRALVPVLPNQACPWVFPVLLEKRSDYDTQLRQAGVSLHSFGIYLHSALFKQGDAAAIDDARHLAERMLCLAVHQDLAPSDIDRSVRIIESMLEKSGPPCN